MCGKGGYSEAPKQGGVNVEETVETEATTESSEDQVEKLIEEEVDAE